MKRLLPVLLAPLLVCCLGACEEVKLQKPASVGPFSFSPPVGYQFFRKMKNPKGPDEASIWVNEDRTGVHMLTVTIHKLAPNDPPDTEAAVRAFAKAFGRRSANFAASKTKALAAKGLKLISIDYSGQHQKWGSQIGFAAGTIKNGYFVLVAEETSAGSGAAIHAARVSAASLAWRTR